jgi:hypothetical protein
VDGNRHLLAVPPPDRGVKMIEGTSEWFRQLAYLYEKARDENIKLKAVLIGIVAMGSRHLTPDEQRIIDNALRKSVHIKHHGDNDD